MEVDDIVPAEVEAVEEPEVPEDSLGDAGETVAGEYLGEGRGDGDDDGGDNDGGMGGADGYLEDDENGDTCEKL